VVVNVNKKGNAVQIQDLEIGRGIYKIGGNISASNYIKLEGINYKGRYIYL
jgi:ABC-type xylose transport system permease subunit